MLIETSRESFEEATENLTRCEGNEQACEGAQEQQDGRGDDLHEEEETDLEARHIVLVAAGCGNKEGHSLDK